MLPWIQQSQGLFHCPIETGHSDQSGNPFVRHLSPMALAAINAKTVELWEAIQTPSMIDVLKL